MSRTMEAPTSVRSEAVPRWMALRAWATFRRGYTEGKEGPQAMRDVLVEALQADSDRPLIQAWVTFHTAYWPGKDGVAAMEKALAAAREARDA